VRAAQDFFLSGIHPILWLTWLSYWLISAGNAKRTVRRETFAQRASHTLPFVAAAVLLSFPQGFPFLCHRLFPLNLVTYWIGTGLLLAGLLFTVWARVILGRNWSGTVTVKENHELIQTGPYRWVRHPIYTGLLAAFLGSALAEDLWSSALAMVIVSAALWVKLLREEAWMRETFGEKYVSYCARTARLVPFLL
jgi:protein-S-isoprenylcysteine O-methyltransferase Ste14